MQDFSRISVGFPEIQSTNLLKPTPVYKRKKLPARSLQFYDSTITTRRPNAKARVMKHAAQLLLVAAFLLSTAPPPPVDASKEAGGRVSPRSVGARPLPGSERDSEEERLERRLDFGGARDGAVAPRSARRTQDAGGEIDARVENEEEEVVVYKVGVLAIRGFERAYQEFNRTFSDYLTATAGERLSTRSSSSSSTPPRRRRFRFELKPLNFNLLFTDVASRLVDFIYVNPSAYSCIESQYGAYSLSSQISLRKVGGESYRLTEFGGVIFARADNDAVNSVRDVRGRTVAAASISGLGSGQMQFRLLQQMGLSYVNDPLRVVFTSNQGKIVKGVLEGRIDVGFVRTDQIERTKGPDGMPVNASLLKVLDPIEDLRQSDGAPFPFASSTVLYAEWNIAALMHVPAESSEEVQRAMLDLARHADVGLDLSGCYEACGIGEGGEDPEAECRERCNGNIVPTVADYRSGSSSGGGGGGGRDWPGRNHGRDRWIRRRRSLRILPDRRPARPRRPIEGRVRRLEDDPVLHGFAQHAGGDGFHPERLRHRRAGLRTIVQAVRGRGMPPRALQEIAGGGGGWMLQRRGGEHRLPG